MPMVIDSHCHTADRWYEPIDTLLHQMDRHRVERAMLIQMLGQFDNGYQQDCAQRHPDRFVSVVGVDVARADAAAELERYRAAAAHACSLGLGVNAGHDLNLHNLGAFAQTLPGLLEVSIGHALIVDAIAMGLADAVRAYRQCLD